MAGKGAVGAGGGASKLILDALQMTVYFLLFTFRNDRQRYPLKWQAKGQLSQAEELMNPASMRYK